MWLPTALLVGSSTLSALACLGLCWQACPTGVVTSFIVLMGLLMALVRASPLAVL